MSSTPSDLLEETRRQRLEEAQRRLREARRRLREKKTPKADIERILRLYERRVFAHDYMRDRKGRPYVSRDYQEDSLESFGARKVHCDGRDVGKTMEIEIMAAWASAARPNSEMLIATQCEHHLFPLMKRVVDRFETTPAFRAGLVEVKRTPSWYARFNNGFVLWGRIAGPRGMNFQGMHVDWQIVDEAQEMTSTSWGELYQALNGGGMRWVYGVPNGLRNDFYHMSKDSSMEYHHWTSPENPDFGDAKRAELARLYGGELSSGFIHRVLGEHGSPEYGVFNLDDYQACVDEGLTFADLAIREGDPFDFPGPIEGGDYYLGCDLGYARDPSEFVLYRADEPHFINVLRARFDGVNYNRQFEAILELDRAYDFRAIGIDSGNNGRSLAHRLMEIGVDWCDRVHAIEFGSSIDLDPLPDGSPNRQPVKLFMTELLQRRMYEKSIVFPPLDDRETQYASHTYVVSPFGRVVYVKGNDHIIDADRCAVLARFLDTRHDAVVPRGIRVEAF